MSGKMLPFYQDVEGVRIPGCFSAEVFRSGLRYKPQPGDFFITGYPKSGTTWLQQLVALIHQKGIPPESFADLSSRSTFLELLGEEGINKMKRPGSIKTHLPFHLVPNSPECKHLHIVRNPKDVVVSQYHHTCSDVYLYQDGIFSDFFEIFMNGATDIGDFFDNVLSWYEHRNDPNVLFITYEELKRNTTDMVKRIAKFMGQEWAEVLEKESVLSNVLKYSSVKSMKDSLNESLNSAASIVDDPNMLEGLRHYAKMQEKMRNERGKRFQLIRKGLIGDWRSTFTEEQNQRMDAKIEEKFKGTDIYKYWKEIECI